jgi:nitroimidazol reductase NimA-like FMN-containing flavoprotein (pyridoxamine 5'-phosphate oxidase superfamily)
MSNETIAQKILNEIQYATIATVRSDGDPWNTPVFCAHDGYTLYWSSHPDSVHSKNIAANNKAFIAIYNSKAGQGEGIGLYIRAAVRILENTEEIAHALTLLGDRRGKPFTHIEKFSNNGPQRIYEATPLQMWTNDAHRDIDGDFTEDFRREVSLS